MLKHLYQIAHINEAAATGAAHEMLGLVIGAAVNALTDVLSASNHHVCDPQCAIGALATNVAADEAFLFGMGHKR